MPVPMFVRAGVEPRAQLDFIVSLGTDYAGAITLNSSCLCITIEFFLNSFKTLELFLHRTQVVR